MSGQAHCQRFPDCLQLGENHKIPKCDKPDCPGARTWADVLIKGTAWCGHGMMASLCPECSHKTAMGKNDAD